MNFDHKLYLYLYLIFNSYFDCTIRLFLEWDDKIKYGKYSQILSENLRKNNVEGRMADYVFHIIIFSAMASICKI